MRDVRLLRPVCDDVDWRQIWRGKNDNSCIGRKLEIQMVGALISAGAMMLWIFTGADLLMVLFSFVR